MLKTKLGVLVVVFATRALAHAQEPQSLQIAWEDNYLTVSGERIPGGPIRIHYLEAYCRPGSTDRDWAETVIKHRAEKTHGDPQRIELADRLEDGVVVRHRIEVQDDAVEFLLEAHNPTDEPSLVHWAQPCMRVDRFTGCGREDARELVPEYARKCFLFVDGELTRLPTSPWARRARYTPGQVYRPKHVPADDVNPRPVSSVTPSCGLTGCFSADEKWILAVAWEPYQEIFQGVIACMHNDFRIGGLAPGERKTIRGKLYLVPANVDDLVARFERDFPEQAR